MTLADRSDADAGSEATRSPLLELTVIIVNWNTRAMLSDCLSSVFANMQQLNVEVIVVDNGSADGSAEMVEQAFPAAILIRNSENRGFAAANNQGLRIATGSYVLLLNSDTIVHRDVLSRSVQYLQTHSDVGVMGCRVLNSDGTMQPTCSRFPSLVNLLILMTGLWKLPWPAFFDRYQMRRWKRLDERDVEVVSGCYMAVRAEAIREIGLLDECFFFFGEETDWCRRFANAGWRLTFAPVGEITHFGGGSSASLNARRDMMLSNALVRLNLKHEGKVRAVLVYLTLYLFNLSRYTYHALCARISPNPLNNRRKLHFKELVSGFRNAWPSAEPFRN